MDRPGHNFLARAGLSQNQHRCVRRSNQLDVLHDILQAGLGSDDRVCNIMPLETREERTILRQDRLA